MYYHIISGTGLVSANGGDGACIPHCLKCDAERRCVQCTDGYFWTGYNCVPSCQFQTNRCCSYTALVQGCLASSSNLTECTMPSANCWWHNNNWFWNHCSDDYRYCKEETNVVKMVNLMHIMHTFHMIDMHLLT